MMYYAYTGPCGFCNDNYADKFLTEETSEHTIQCGSCKRESVRACAGKGCIWCKLMSGDNYNPDTKSSVYKDFDRAMKGI